MTNWLKYIGIYWSWDCISQIQRDERCHSGEFFLLKISSHQTFVAQDGDDIIEQPIPEQFKTTISGKKLITSATESV